MVALHIVEQQGCYKSYIVCMFHFVFSWNCPFNTYFVLLFANAEKCELAKREEACMNRLRNTVGIYVIYGFQELKPQPFLNTPIRSGIIHNGTGLGLVIETLTGTLTLIRLHERQRKWNWNSWNVDTDSTTAERKWMAEGNFFPYASDRTYQTWPTEIRDTLLLTTIVVLMPSSASLTVPLNKSTLSPNDYLQYAIQTSRWKLKYLQNSGLFSFKCLLIARERKLILNRLLPIAISRV